VNTSSEALIMDRQTTDVLLISAEFQDVTVYKITRGKTVKRPYNTQICILFSSTRLNILLKQVGNSFNVLIGYGLGHGSLILALN
jgi:hypothetical protein